MSKVIYGISRVLAWVGSIVLLTLAVMIVVSITGRTLTNFGLGPIQGDFEMVEIGTALAVFCFLPWAHITRSHAVVDLFWRAYPPALQKVLIFISDLLMLVLWVVLIWRMMIGMESYRANGEVSFILQWPVWWGYAACLVPGVFGCVVYAWRLLEDLGLASEPVGFVAEKGEH